MSRVSTVFLEADSSTEVLTQLGAQLPARYLQQEFRTRKNLLSRLPRNCNLCFRGGAGWQKPKNPR